MARPNWIALANSALAKFSGGVIQSFDQSVAPGPAVNLVFWDCILGLLAEYPWSFTKHTVKLIKTFGAPGGGGALEFYDSPDYQSAFFSLADPAPGSSGAAAAVPCPYPFFGGVAPTAGSPACAFPYPGLPPLFGVMPPPGAPGGAPTLGPSIAFLTPDALAGAGCDPSAAGYPPAGWKYGYAMPPQALDTFKFLTSPDYADAPVTRYEIQGQTIWCDESSLWAGARFAVDYESWPQYFITAVQLCLAAELIMPITGAAGLLDKAQVRAWGTPEEDRSGGMLGVAKRRDAQISGVRKLPPDPLTLARIGGGGAGEGGD